MWIRTIVTKNKIKKKQIQSKEDFSIIYYIEFFKKLIYIKDKSY